MHCEKRMREMVVSLSSLLSFLLVSEATILPHYKIPVTGSALKLTPMLTLWLKHDGFQEEERAMSPANSLLCFVQCFCEVFGYGEFCGYPEF